jgi:hypothetical protein
MPVTLLAAIAIIANHTPATGGGPGNPMVGWVFGGLVATAVWLLFSRLRWRSTVAVTVAGWVVGLGLLVGL